MQCAVNNVRGRAVRYQVLAWALVGLQAWGIPLRTLAQVVPAGGAVQVITNPNGVPVVNINAANGAGVSHNQYTHYNVDARGLVLNNHPATPGNMVAPTNSQLAGSLLTNPNLPQSARVILNEVVAPNRSQLAGFTEVAGARADVVVANPYGITCNGCGFINTSRALLGTGVPVFGADGSLTGLRVSGGDLRIEGMGLNGTDTTLLDLVSRSVRLEGQVNGRDVTITTGVGTFDVPGRVMMPVTLANGAPALAIDSTVLGGMYADRIKIVSTEAGVGVRMQGPVVASATDVGIHAGGAVMLHGPVSAARDVHLSSTAGTGDALVLQDARVVAGRDLALQAQGAAITLSGGQLQASGGNLALDAARLTDSASGASVGGQNSRSAAGQLHVNTAGLAQLTDVQYQAGGALSGQLGDLRVGGTGTTLSGQTIDVLAAHGMALGSSTVVGAGDVNLTTGAGGFSYAGGTGQAIQSQAGNVNLVSGAALDQSGTVSAVAGSLALRSAGTLTNSGTLSAGADVRMTDTAGTGTQAIINRGTVAAGGALSVASQTLHNSGTIGAQQAGTIGVAGQLDNAGVLAAQNGLMLSADSLVNQAGAQMGAVAQDVYLNTNRLDNAGEIVAQQGNLSVQGLSGQTLSVTNAATGALVSSDTLTIAGQGGSANATLVNAASSAPAGTQQGGIQGQTVNLNLAQLTNQGVINATEASQVQVSGLLDNQAGAVMTLNQTSGAQSTVNAGTLANAGVMQGGGTLALSAGAGGISNTGQVVAEAGRLVLQSAGTIRNVGGLSGNGVHISDASAGRTEVFDNTGQVVSDGALTVAAQTLRNSGTLQGAVGGTVTAGQLTNSGTVYLGAQSGDATVLAGELVNAGTLFAGHGLQTSVSGTLANSGKLGAEGNLQVSANRIENAASGGIGSNDGQATLQTNALANSGLVFADGDLSVQGLSAQTLSVTNAATGALVSSDTLTIAGQGGSANATLVNAASSAPAGTQQGGIQGQTVNLNLAQLTNQGVINATEASQVQVSGLLDNQAGAVMTLNQTSGAQSTVNAGTLANAGVMQGGGTLALSAGAGGISNTGQVVAEAGRLVLQSAGTIRNVGGLSGNGVHISDASAGRTEVFDNTGQVVSDGALTVAAQTLRNSGTLQGAVGGTVTAGQLTNSGTVYLGAQSGDATVLAGELVNAGTLFAGHGLQTSVSGTLANSGKLGAEGNLQVSANRIENAASGGIGSNDGQATLQTNALTNSGLVFADGDLSVQGLSAQTLSVTNAATGALVSSDTLTIAGQGGSANATLVNAASSAPAGTQQGGIQGQTVNLNLAQLTNQGVINATEASQVQVSGLLDNQAGAVMTLNQTSGAQSTVNAGTLANAGTIQGKGDATLAAQGALSNAGMVNLGNGQVQAATLSNTGVLQAQRHLSVQSGAVAIGSTGLIDAGESLSLGTGSLSLADNGAQGATIQSGGATTIHAGTLTLGGTNAAILAARNGGQAALSTGNGLSNPGLVFSGGDLTVNAPWISNGMTGALSALGALSLNVGGGIYNAGQLYGQRAINLQAGSEVVNIGALDRPIGRIDSDGDVTVQTGRFVNNSEINAAGNVTVSAASFSNAVVGGDTRQWVLPDVVTEKTTRCVNGACDENDIAESATMGGRVVGEGGGGTKTGSIYWNTGFLGLFDSWRRDYYEDTVTNTQYYAGGTPTYQPKLVAGKTLTVQNFHQGENLAAVLSGRTVNLLGAPGASFVNDNLALLRKDYTAKWSILTHWSWYVFGEKQWDHVAQHLEITTQTTQLDSQAPLTAGIYADTLNAQGFSLTNQQSPYPLASRVFGTPQAEASAAYLGSAAFSGGAIQAAGAQGAALAGVQHQAGGAVSAVAVPGGGYRPAPGLFDAMDLGSGRVWLAGAVVNLPSNPNGLFVASANPSAGYLIETNPRYRMGAKSVGSDYLLRQVFKYEPTRAIKRLGDANYEASLVSQEMLAQTGLRLSTAYRDDAEQMRGLMDNAVAQAGELGLVVGQSLTPEQVSRLKQDIVWLVNVQVNGQQVLAPMVYLAPGKHEALPAGATIMARNVNLELDRLTNVGGTLAGTERMVAKVQGDIDNVGGVIRGGDVGLISVTGSVRNTTLELGNEKNTMLGQIARIEAKDTLLIKAAQDIQFKGALGMAGGSALLDAGRDLVLDTAKVKTTEQQIGVAAWQNADGSTGPKLDQRTTRTVQNVGSALLVGGNLATRSGRDTTLVGATVSAGGDLVMDAGRNLDILAAQDTHTVQGQREQAGFGVGGSLYGTEKLTVNTVTGTNVGSSVQAGGNALLKAGQTLTLQGSDLLVGKDAALVAKDIQVLAGRNESSFEMTKEQTGILSGLHTDASGKLQGDLWAKSQTQVRDFTSNARGSRIQAGGNLAMVAERDVLAVGAELGAGRDLAIQGENVRLLAAQDIHQQSVSTQTESVGFSSAADRFVQNGGSSSMGTAGLTSAEGMKAYAMKGISLKGEVNAGASHDSFFGASQYRQTDTSLQVKNHGTQLRAGGALAVVANEALTLQGADLVAGGDVLLKGRNIANLAAEDVALRTRDVESSSQGVYLNQKVSMHGHGAADSTLSGSTTGWGASADGRAGIGYSDNRDTLSTSEQTTRAVVSSIRSGGNVVRVAQDRLLDVGTAIEAKGDVVNMARTFDSLAAADTYSQRTTREHADASVGLYGAATAEAQGGSGGAITGFSVSQSSAGAQAVVGFEAGHRTSQASETSRSSRAVVSQQRAGGDIVTLTTGKTTLEGTTLQAQRDVAFEVGEFEAKAARDTYSKRSDSSTSHSHVEAGIGGQAGAMTGGGAGAGLTALANASAGYAKESNQEQTNLAVVSELQAGRDLRVKTTQGDLRLEGTVLKAGQDAVLDSAGRVRVDAARNLFSSTQATNRYELSIGGEIDVSPMPTTAANSVFLTGSASTKNVKRDVQEDQAQVAQLEIGRNFQVKSRGDTTFEGTRIAVANDVDLDVGGNLAFNAARSTRKVTETGLELNVSVSGSTGRHGATQVAGDVELLDSKTTDTGHQQMSLVAGGAKRVRVAGDFSQEVKDGQAPVIDAAVVSAGGSKTMTTVQDRHEVEDFGFALNNGRPKEVQPVNQKAAQAVAAQKAKTEGNGTPSANPDNVIRPLTLLEDLKNAGSIAPKVMLAEILHSGVPTAAREAVRFGMTTAGSAVPGLSIGIGAAAMGLPLLLGSVNIMHAIASRDPTSPDYQKGQTTRHVMAQLGMMANTAAMGGAMLGHFGTLGVLPETFAQGIGPAQVAGQVYAWGKAGSRVVFPLTNNNDVAKGEKTEVASSAARQQRIGFGAVMLSETVGGTGMDWQNHGYKTSGDAFITGAEKTGFNTAINAVQTWVGETAAAHYAGNTNLKLSIGFEPMSLFSLNKLSAMFLAPGNLARSHTFSQLNALGALLPEGGLPTGNVSSSLANGSLMAMVIGANAIRASAGMQPYPAQWTTPEPQSWRARSNDYVVESRAAVKTSIKEMVPTRLREEWTQSKEAVKEASRGLVEMTEAASGIRLLSPRPAASGQGAQAVGTSSQTLPSTPMPQSMPTATPTAGTQEGPMVPVGLPVQ
ncbi:two-partner secretion domain-containing protein [Cupriavidus necator]